MSVVEPAAGAGGGGPNRLFIVLALGLVGLLILGLVVIGGIFAIQQMAKPAVPPTATRISIAFTTPTRAALVVLTPTAVPTDTPPPATPTLVVQPVSGGTTPVLGGTLTLTAVAGTVTPGTGTPASDMPPTGIGENLLLLAGGVVLVFVIIAARRARTTAAG